MYTPTFSLQLEQLYKDSSGFDALALDIFRYQASENKIYAEYLSLLGVKPNTIHKVSDIPCLPIAFFKNKSVMTKEWTPKMEFLSSGTGQVQSRHPVKDPILYLENTVRGFEHFFGKVEDYCFLALLPSYLEREGSSLVYMLEHFISLSKYEQSGFYLSQFDQLREKLLDCKQKGIPTILFGVPFGLLDFGEWSPMDLSEFIIFETGGMKGRRAELTKPALYSLLQAYFQPKHIYSEYGMTEMFSQAYATKIGVFKAAPSMDIYVRELNDPFNNVNFGRIGAINVIDLANFATISFIATDDLGRKHQDGTFEILGRLDNSDLRGCNLLIQEL
jgi:hypothetical protein